MNIEILTWILCGSHGKFENTHQPVSESKLDSNPNWIYVGPSLLPLLGPLLFLLVLQKFAFGLWDFEQWELEPRFPIRKFSNNPNKIVIFMSQTELEEKKNSNEMGRSRFTKAASPKLAVRKPTTTTRLPSPDRPTKLSKTPSLFMTFHQCSKMGFAVMGWGLVFEVYRDEVKKGKKIKLR